MRNLFLFFGALVCVLFAGGCSAERHSVFYAVTSDRAEIDSNLENDLSIIGMADNGTNYYIAAAGALWWRPISDNTSPVAAEWQSVTIPADTVLCTAFIGHAGSLYAGFMDIDNNFALYSGSFGANPGWVKVSDAQVLDKQVTRLYSFSGPDMLFASVKEDSGYSLYSSADGSDFIATGISASEYPVTSMIFAESNYWAVTRGQIYRDNNANITTSFITPPAGEAGESFQAICYSPTQDKYFVSFNNGLVYASADSGLTWPEASELQTTSNDKKIVFTQIAEVDDNIMVGTLNNGFYQTKTGAISALAPHEDELVSDINTSSVLDFYVDTSEQVVFFLTGGYGLYRNTFTDGAWGALIHE